MKITLLDIKDAFELNLSDKKTLIIIVSSLFFLVLAGLAIGKIGVYFYLSSHQTQEVVDNSDDDTEPEDSPQLHKESIQSYADNYFNKTNKYFSKIGWSVAEPQINKEKTKFLVDMKNLKENVSCEIAISKMKENWAQDVSCVDLAN